MKTNRSEMCLIWLQLNLDWENNFFKGSLGFQFVPRWMRHIVLLMRFRTRQMHFTVTYVLYCLSYTFYCSAEVFLYLANASYSVLCIAEGFLCVSLFSVCVLQFQQTLKLVFLSLFDVLWKIIKHIKHENTQQSFLWLCLLLVWHFCDKFLKAL